jgi:hypothetical protein
MLTKTPLPTLEPVNLKCRTRESLNLTGLWSIETSVICGLPLPPLLPQAAIVKMVNIAGIRNEPDFMMLI